jgi:hypothetical protein
MRLQEDSLSESYDGISGGITNLKYIEKKQRGKIIYKIIYSGFSSVKKQAVYY